MRWKDKVRRDLKRFGIEEASCFRVAQERGFLRTSCKGGGLNACIDKRMELDRARRDAAAATRQNGTNANFTCDSCQRSFR